MKESLKTVSNCKLLRGLNELVTKGRQNEAGLLAYLAEVDKRQLYLGMACSSMHRYCTTMLHFSEGMAYHRIAVARASCRYPLLLERIREGALHLAGAYLLASKLTPQNQVELLDLARHRTKRAIAPGRPGAEARRAGADQAAPRPQAGLYSDALGDQRAHTRGAAS